MNIHTHKSGIYSGRKGHIAYIFYTKKLPKLGSVQKVK